MAEKKAFVLRVDVNLFSAIEKWAEDEFRSTNGQIEFILREALKTRHRASHPCPQCGSIHLLESVLPQKNKAEIEE